MLYPLTLGTNGYGLHILRSTTSRTGRPHLNVVRRPRSVVTFVVYPDIVGRPTQVGQNVAVKIEEHNLVKKIFDKVSKTPKKARRGKGDTAHYDGRQFMDKAEADAQVAAISASLRRYGELCQMTYSTFMPVEEGSTNKPAPPPTVRAVQKSKLITLELLTSAVTGVRNIVFGNPNARPDPFRVPALPPALFLAPHPVVNTASGSAVTEPVQIGVPDSYPYDEATLNGYGFLEHDSPVIKAGYEVSTFLYGPAGIVDRSGQRAGKARWIGYIAHSKKLQEVVLVFRGTILADEWSQNADFRAYPIHNKVYCPPGTSNKKVLAHNGFTEMYYHGVQGHCNLRDQVLDGLQETCGRLDWKPSVLTVTGHSLGGALATMAAYDLVHVANCNDSINGLFSGGLANCIQGVTWAQPRVGNKEYIQEFEALIGERNWLRLVNEGDIVPKVPFATMSWAAELADNIYYWRQSGAQDPRKPSHGDFVLKASSTATKQLTLKARASQVAQEVRSDLKVQISQAEKTAYEHVGWELRFDPGDKTRFYYLNMQRFQDSEAWDKWLYIGLAWAVRQAWVLAQPIILSVVSGDAAAVMDEEPIYLEKLGPRHNLELMMHMVDPTMDKARLNKSDDILLISALDPEDQARIAERKNWWWPYSHSQMVLVADPDTQTSKWVKVQDRSA